MLKKAFLLSFVLVSCDVMTTSNLLPALKQKASHRPPREATPHFVTRRDEEGRILFFGTSDTRKKPFFQLSLILEDLAELIERLLQATG